MLPQGGWGSRSLASLISLLSLCICCPQQKCIVKTTMHSTRAERAELTGRQRVAAEEALVAEDEGVDVEVLRVGSPDEGLLLISTVPLCPTPASKLEATWQEKVMAGPERSWSQEQKERGGGGTRKKRQWSRPGRWQELIAGSSDVCELKTSRDGYVMRVELSWHSTVQLVQILIPEPSPQPTSLVWDSVLKNT